MKAHELLVQPGKWTRQATAKDVYGDRIHPNSKFAVCFCVYGAIQKCYAAYEDYDKHCDALRGWIAKNVPGNPTIAAWNDAPTQTLEKVVAVLKELGI